MARESRRIIDEISGIPSTEAQNLIERKYPGSRISPVLVSRRGRRAPVDLARWGAWNEDSPIASVHKNRTGNLSLLTTRGPARPFSMDELAPVVSVSPAKKIFVYGMLPDQFAHLSRRLRDIPGLDLRELRRKNQVKLSRTDIPKDADYILSNRFIAHADTDAIAASGVSHVHTRAGGITGIEDKIRELMGHEPRSRVKAKGKGKNILGTLALMALPSLLEQLSGPS